MWPTLEELKTWLGITGTDDDAWLTHKREVTISLIERYCNRLFEKGTYTEVYNLWRCKTAGISEVFLYAQPVESITSVDGVTGWELTDYGTLCLGSSCAGREESGDITVEYVGGFDPLPAEVTDVFYNMISSAYATKDVVNTGGQIKKETIMGVVSTEYTTGSDAGESDPAMPGYYGPMLDSYVIGKT